MSTFDWRGILGRARLWARQSAASAAVSTLARWWNSPMLSQERRDHPLPPRLSGRMLLLCAGGVMLIPIAAWVIDIRLVSAAVLGLCLASAALPILAAPIIGAGMAAAARDQSTFTSTSPGDAALGAALVTLWRLRWLIAVGLALTPALMVSLLRLDIATFSAYRDSVLALGSAAPTDQVSLLLPGGAIPYFRLIIRDLSGGLLAWAILPLGAALGLAGALALDDVTFGQLAGLIATVAALLVSVVAWSWLSLTPLLAGPLEALRLVLLAGMVGGLGWLAIRAAKLNAQLLLIR